MTQDNMEEITGTGSGDDDAVEQLISSALTPSGTPNNPSDAPWITRADPILSIPELSENRIESNTERPGSIVGSNFLPITNYIYKTEKCSRYREMDLLDPTWKHYMRYRVVVVVRDDALAEYIEEIGPSDQVPGSPVNIVGGEGAVIVETFETMKAMAEQFREELWPHHRHNMDPMTRNKDEFNELINRRVI